MINNIKNKTISAALILSVFLAGGCASTGTSPEKEADYHNKIGRAYLNEGKLQLAFVEFQKAMQSEPDNKDIVYNLGIVYFQLQDYENAKKYFLKAVSLDPKFADAYNNLGATYMQLRQWGPAADSFKKALANPFYRTPEWAFYNLVMSYYRLGEYEKALEAYKDSIRRDRSFVLSYYGMALAYNKMEKYGDASEVLTRAIEIDPAYKGNREKKEADLREEIYTANRDEEQDLRDYLEIMQY